jgi:hypothetical protein
VKARLSAFLGRPGAIEFIRGPDGFVVGVFKEKK